jgi:hypothetical protein
MSGRGRLSIIEQLPEDFDDIVLWAAGELRERKQLQIDILAEFNRRLKARAEETGIEVPEVTSSSFSRYSMKLAALTRQLEETRAITRVITERLEPGETDDLTIATTEILKNLVFEITSGTYQGKLTPKATMELANAMRAATAAQSMSADRRRRLEDELAVKTEKALSQVVKTKGLSAATAEEIKRQILGIGG